RAGVLEVPVTAGKRCTAIRRAFVPADRLRAATDALAARLGKIVVGDPRRDDVRMGPLVTRAQQEAALQGIRRIGAEVAFISGSIDPPDLDGIDREKSAFLAPTLLRVADSATAHAVHETEVFGPVASILAYRDADDAFRLVARGGGSLVASIYGEDRDFLTKAVGELASLHGRLLVVD